MESIFKVLDTCGGGEIAWRGIGMRWKGCRGMWGGGEVEDGE